jgi:hypothetical protein
MAHLFFGFNEGGGERPFRVANMGILNWYQVFWVDNTKADAPAEHENGN